MLAAANVHRIDVPLDRRITSVYVVIGTHQTAIIDAGDHRGVNETVIPYLVRAGVELNSIEWILLTHCDFDHVSGATLLKAHAPGARVACGAPDRQLIEDSARLIADRYSEFRDLDQIGPDEAAIAELHRDVIPVMTDHVLADGEVIDLGDRSLKAIATPGHSDGHFAFLEPDAGVLFFGDAVLGTGVPYSDGAPAFPPTYRDVDRYLGTIQELRREHIELALSGHYPAMDAAQWRVFLDDSETFVAGLEASILTVLQASRPLSTREVIGMVHTDRWPDDPGALVYAVVGHLERLAAAGVIAATEQRPRRWLRAGDR